MPTKPHSQAAEGIGADTIRRNDQCFAPPSRIARLHDRQPRGRYRTSDQGDAPSGDRSCPCELQATVTATGQLIGVRCATAAQTLQLGMAGHCDSAQHQRERHAMQRGHGAAESQQMHKRYGRAERGRSFQDEVQIAGQSRLKISVPLVPPNPKEFDSAARIGISRALSGA